MGIEFELGKIGIGITKNISYINDNYPKYILNYPCISNSDCTYYKAKFKHGIYSITICGASGGFSNNEPISQRKNPDTPYAGGCSSGIITIPAPTYLYIYLGGHGITSEDDIKPPPGFNGGGSGNAYHSSSSGGGASDIRAESNDVFHRIIVAGGGGGGDNPTTDIVSNDGKGGSGGGLIAQGFYVSSNSINNEFVAGQTEGFSFGQGEAGSTKGTKHPHGSPNVNLYNDIGGAGGGWFGGFASHHYNQGAGGGSSFILTRNATIPKGRLEYRNENYTELISSGEYAFANRKYIFADPKLERGVWYGHGFVEITIISQSNYGYAECRCNSKRNLYLISVMILTSY